MCAKRVQSRVEDISVPERLVRAGLRPTRQRLFLARILFEGPPKHVTAEQIMRTVRQKRASVSLATIYNTLNQFTKAGLLREVSVDQSRTYFDTTLTPHHHFFDEVTGRLWDIPGGELMLGSLPEPPPGRRIAGVDVTVRLGKKT